MAEHLTPPRAPKFLTEAQHGKAVVPASFTRGGTAGAAPISPPLNVARLKPEPVRESEARDESKSAPAPRIGFAPAAAPASAVDASAALERLTSAVDSLKLHGEHLAQQARSDALEIGFQVAKRILEMELTTNPAPLFALVRSAVQRVGESRRVTVRLCPADLARVDPGAGKSITGLTLAQVDWVGDASLTAGDCVVEADFGSVDGRLATRLEELRRVVASAMGADGP